MKKINHLITTTYEVGFNDFMVDIVEDKSAPKYFEAYIYNIKYGTKELMFGIPNTTHDEFLDIVKSNLIDHMKYYEEDHCY